MTDEEDIIEKYETALNEEQSKNSKLSGALSSSTIYNNSQDSNLIVYQLELDNILEKIEHLLRGDVIKINENGELDYFAPEDKNLIILNEYGVQLIMNIISVYLNRNTILSFYDEQRIYRILTDLGDTLADLIFCNYEKMGMDNEAKKSRYPILVLSILHLIESTYKRSLEGGERESLRSARVVTQSEGLRNMPGYNMGTPQKKSFSILDRSTW